MLSLPDPLRQDYGINSLTIQQQPLRRPWLLLSGHLPKPAEEDAPQFSQGASRRTLPTSLEGKSNEKCTDAHKESRSAVLLSRFLVPLFQCSITQVNKIMNFLGKDPVEMRFAEVAMSQPSVRHWLCQCFLWRERQTERKYWLRTVFSQRRGGLLPFPADGVSGAGPGGRKSQSVVRCCPPPDDRE